ncbi:hypothetical protein I4U23_003272 [Adineta vaga]|nr:hypothetical protein I4U23_003272 [Adineta vaga]
MDESFERIKSLKYPADPIESVHSDIPGDPQIKIRFAGTNEEDDGDATISIDTEPEIEVDDDNDEEDITPIKKKKLPKSKTEDIHSFL